MDIEVKTVSEIQKIFNDDKPKFVALVDESGKFVVNYNSPQITAAKRFKDIENKLHSKSLPDGIYFFLYKDSLHRGATEFRFAVGKGKFQSTKITLRDSQSLTAPAESVWSVQQAVTILAENNFLKLENASLKKDVADAEEYIKELEAENQVKNPAGTGMSENNLVNDLKEFYQLIAPSWDEYMKLEHRKVALKEQQLSQGGKAIPQRSVNKKNVSPGKREDGGVKVDDPAYEDYFANIYNQGTDQILNYELDVLQQSNPQLYEKIVQQYQIEVEPVDESDSGDDRIANEATE